MRRDTPKPTAFSAPPFFERSDRFGDAPLQPHSRKNPTKVKNKPAWGGNAPPGVERGFTHKPEEVLPHVGTSATSVERFDLSEPGGAYVSKHRTRRPHEYDWMDSTLSPARYSPDVLHPTMGGRLAPNAPRWRISGGPKKMAPLPMEGESKGASDLMYSLPPTIGKQPTSGSKTAFAPHFGTEREKRMEYRQFAPLESNASAQALLRKSKRGLERGQGQSLSAEERDLLKRDIREARELGARSAQSYMPPSAFDSSASHSNSQSFSFGRSESKRGLLEDTLPVLLELGAQRAIEAPPPPYGGKMGVAFRSQPKMTPGPGDYTQDEGRSVCGGAFDGTGKLKLSKSSPAIKMLGKVPLDQLMGRGETGPDPCAYFQTPNMTPKLVPLGKAKN